MTDEQTFIELTNQKRELDARLKKVNEMLSEVEQRLIQQFAATMQTSCKVAGHTLYLSRDLSVSMTSGGNAVADVLREMGHEEMATVNVATLKSFLKELMMDEATGEWELNPNRLPADLREVLQLDERTSLRCRKG